MELIGTSRRKSSLPVLRHFVCEAITPVAMNELVSDHHGTPFGVLGSEMKSLKHAVWHHSTYTSHSSCFYRIYNAY